MLKKIILSSAMALLVGCGGSSDNPAPTDPAPGVNPGGGGNPGGNPGAPSGPTEGTWSGSTDFGNGVYIIDAAQNLFGLSSDGAGQFKSLFGNITGNLARYDHRVSDDLTFGDGITIVGTPDENFAEIAYTFTASDDGSSLTNTSNFGSFTMNRAPDNSISIADVVGSWETKTAFCAQNCPLSARLTIAADGALSGATNASATQDAAGEVPLSGTVTGGGQFLSVTFVWSAGTGPDGLSRAGVIYRDIGTQKLVLNTVGFESAQDGNRSFSGIFTRLQ